MGYHRGFFLANGKRYTGEYHRMGNGETHTGKTHTSRSRRLFRYGALSEAVRKRIEGR